MTTTQNKKRILFLAPQPFFEIRGTPIATKDMLGILSSKFDIDLITYPIGLDIKLEGIKHTRCYGFGFKKIKIGISVKKILLDFSLFVSALKKILTTEYFTIHGVEEAALIGVFCKFLTKSHLVYDMDSILSEQVQASRFKHLTFATSFIERVIVKNSDLVLGISQDFEIYCHNLSPRSRFIRIWDVAQGGQRELPSKLAGYFKSENKKVIYIGNGESYQGLELLEETALLMPWLDFFIIGAGRSGESKNIKFIPQVDIDYVSEIMKRADVLISPRLRGTNTPMKIYAYMQSGKPIVMTNIPAHEALRKYGYIAELNKFDMKEQVILALEDKGNLGVLAKKKVEKDFSFEKLKKTILENYPAGHA